MPSRAPLLGSLAIQSPSPQSSQLVHVSPATCHNLSLFKELLKEYRKLDDTVTTRINRTTAQFRDRERLGANGKGSVQEQACAYLWKELVGARGQNPIITRRLDVFHRSKQTGNAELKLSIIV